MAALVLPFFFIVSPGCLTNGPSDMNLTESGLADQYLASADAIADYRSEYFVTSGIAGGNPVIERIRYDYKSPDMARMEIVEIGSRIPGTFATTNRSVTAWYSAETNTYDTSSYTNLRRNYDYQFMVRQIIADRNFTIIGRDFTGERARYQIEVVTPPWSDRYTSYISSRIRAWIEPSTGLAWTVTTYYDPGAGPTLPPGAILTPTQTPLPPDASLQEESLADVPNNEVSYESIEVNCGIPDSYFDFVPPEGSGPRCVPKYVNYVEPPRTDMSTPISQPLPGGVSYSLNESDSGREVTMHTGEVIEITLRTSPGLAYRWIMPSEGSGLELMNAGSIFEMEEGHEIAYFGMRGYYRWRFLAINPGTQTFDGIFTLDGCDIQNAKRFNLTVHVTED